MSLSAGEQELLSFQSTSAGLSAEVWVRAFASFSNADASFSAHSHPTKRSGCPHAVQGSQASVLAKGGAAASFPLCVAGEPAFLSLNTSGARCG